MYSSVTFESFVIFWQQAILLKVREKKKTSLIIFTARANKETAHEMQLKPLPKRKKKTNHYLRIKI